FGVLALLNDGEQRLALPNQIFGIERENVVASHAGKARECELEHLPPGIAGPRVSDALDAAHSLIDEAAAELLELRLLAGGMLGGDLEVVTERADLRGARCEPEHAEKSLCEFLQARRLRIEPDVA